MPKYVSHQNLTIDDNSSLEKMFSVIYVKYMRIKAYKNKKIGFKDPHV